MDEAKIKALEQQDRLLSVEQVATFLNMDADVLRSMIWLRNFPTSGVWGQGAAMRINPQTLAVELRERQKPSYDSGVSPLGMAP